MTKRLQGKLLSAILHILLLQMAWSQSCRPQQFQLSSDRQVLNITSPNYPNAYTPGSSCRYRIVAPMDHVVILQCRYEVYPNSCRTEQLLVSRDGDLQFRDSTTYCSSVELRLVSHFRALALAYRSADTSGSWRARFHCQAQARPQSSCQCGWTLATRISNGQEAARAEFPSAVALRDISSSQRIFCGGSIVSHRHIVTAAHCTRAVPDASRIRALVGYHDLDPSSSSAFAVEHNIARIISHPGYASTADTVRNDIALLVTSAAIEWSRGVGPICLPLRQASNAFTYRNVDVVGWGTLFFAGPKASALQKVQLLTLDNSACQQQYNASIAATQLCTYDYRGLGQDACQYDSGGPVILRESRQFLLGIISYGRACGARYAIGINTRLTAYIGWLWTYVGGGVCVY